MRKFSIFGTGLAMALCLALVSVTVTAQETQKKKNRDRSQIGTLDNKTSGASFRASKLSACEGCLTSKYMVSTISATPILRELVQLAPPQGGENVSPESSEVDDESDGRELSNNSSQSPESSDGSEPPQQLTQKTLRTAQQGVAVLAGLFQTTFGVVGNSMLIFFFGLFVAIGPQQYRDGIVVLFPLRRRERTREVMNMLGDTLWRWLIGRFGSMLVTGIGTGVLLTVLGVPMALTIGVLTALLTFIPNIGAIISLTLAVLLALPQNGSTVIMVIVGYIALQLIESYIVTPLIEQQQVSLPPALLIAFQVVMGVLFGFLGAAVASPLLAVTKVCVEQVYIKDVLESESSI